MKKKSAVSAALLCAGLMRCAAALADTVEPQLLPEPDQVMQMGSGLGGAALVVAVLALIVAIALFLISSMNNARLRSEVSALQRRLKETETDRARSARWQDPPRCSPFMPRRRLARFSSPGLLLPSRIPMRSRYGPQ